MFFHRQRLEIRGAFSYRGRDFLASGAKGNFVGMETAGAESRLESVVDVSSNEVPTNFLPAGGHGYARRLKRVCHTAAGRISAQEAVT
jgi:hypothetical protein